MSILLFTVQNDKVIRRRVRVHSSEVIFRVIPRWLSVFNKISNQLILACLLVLAFESG